MNIEYVIKTPRLSLMEQFLIEVFDFERFERDDDGSVLFSGPFLIRLRFSECITEDSESHIKITYPESDEIEELKTKIKFFYYRLGHDEESGFKDGNFYDPDGRKWEVGISKVPQQKMNASNSIIEQYLTKDVL